MNNRERELWISNDENLYRWWKESGLSMRQFIKDNRGDIDRAIDYIIEDTRKRNKR